MLLYKLQTGENREKFPTSPLKKSGMQVGQIFSRLQLDIKKRDVKDVLISLSESEEAANRSNSIYIELLLLRFPPSLVCVAFMASKKKSENFFMVTSKSWKLLFLELI